MKYEKVVKANFAIRINRFTAKVVINGIEETVHIKNTGRCKELFTPGAVVYLNYKNTEKRKTKYDLIAVEKNSNKVVNVDSQIPNDLIADWIKSSGLFSENAKIKREVFFQNSRFDLYIEDGERRAFIEVKGVTLEENGVALFPDAPTERGLKHLSELMNAIDNGYEAYVIFVIQLKDVTSFSPNIKTHKAFADMLSAAKKHGVKILALDCIVTPDNIEVDKSVEVVL